MPELRKDPVIGRWVIIATERSKRPNDYKVNDVELNNKESCPFCPGNEQLTPPEILAYREAGTRENSPGWWLRIIPNKFPALQVESEINRTFEGIYDKMNGFGAHEVIIETTEHDSHLAMMSEKTIEESLWAYRDRIMDLKKDSRFKYILIFKNHGSAAGASLSHPHTQLIAIPIIPKRVKEEMDGAKDYYDYKERCVFCDIIKNEAGSQDRVVWENQSFIVIEPFASRFPFETWVLPKVHDCSFENAQKNEITLLARTLKVTLEKINKALNNPPYNYILHTSPCGDNNLNYYHWHIEIIPKLSKVAGFEWGSGFYINPTSPEKAADFLRES